MRRALQLSGFVIHGNHAQTLGACLEGLIAVCDEVVAVDSCSNDGSADIARALGARRVTLPWQGCGAARGKAMEVLAPADYVFFLDADEAIDAQTVARIRAWKQGTPTLPYYTLQRRDWAELESGRFLFRRERRKRLVRADHARWTPDLILHDALPKDDAAPLQGAFIDHHFAQSIAGIEDKQELYSLLYAVRLVAGGARPKSTFGRRTAHVLRDGLLKGAVFRGGMEGLRLAWAVSKTHARKYEIMRDIARGEHRQLVELFREGRYEELFRAATR